MLIAGNFLSNFFMMVFDVVIEARAFKSKIRSDLLLKSGVESFPMGVTIPHGK